MTRRVALVLLDPRTPPAAPPGNRVAHWRAALAEDVAAPAGGLAAPAGGLAGPEPDAVRRLRAAAPGPRDVASAPGRHRLRETDDVRPLDPALEGRDAPRALLPAGPR